LPGRSERDGGMMRKGNRNQDTQQYLSTNVALPAFKAHPDITALSIQSDDTFMFGFKRHHRSSPFDNKELESPHKND
jgi:hypothetical protein